MSFCGNCGARVNDDDNFCTSCGARLKRPASGSPMPQPAGISAQAAATSQTAQFSAPEVEFVYESKFTGGAFANFFINLLTLLVSVITLSLAYPAMVCFKKRWEANHTYLNGRKLRFDGKAMQLIGKFIVWVLLSVITLGLYYIFCMRVALEKWYAKHTHFTGTPEETGKDGSANGSEFDGTSLGLLGVKILTGFVTVITLTFGSYWAYCYKQRWFCKHTTVDGARLYFDGKAGQYFGKRICWLLLTVITIGIYSFWLTVKSKKWTILHTKVSRGAQLPPADGSCAPIATESRAQNVSPDANAEESQQQQKTPIGTVGFILSLVGIFMPYLCIAGIICSIVSLAKKYNNKYAVAGLVIGVIELVLIIAMIIVTVVVVPRL